MISRFTDETVPETSRYSTASDRATHCSKHQAEKQRQGCSRLGRVMKWAELVLQILISHANKVAQIRSVLITSSCSEG